MQLWDWAHATTGARNHPIDNALTADEIAAGRLTPEVMWKMSRAGSSSLSPDGTTLLYAQTDYNMAQNRGVTTIWVQDMASGAVTRLTDNTSNNMIPSGAPTGVGSISCRIAAARCRCGG